jgi:hypothetical protein
VAATTVVATAATVQAVARGAKPGGHQWIEGTIGEELAMPTVTEPS